MSQIYFSHLHGTVARPVESHQIKLVWLFVLLRTKKCCLHVAIFPLACLNHSCLFYPFAITLTTMLLSEGSNPRAACVARWICVTRTLWLGLICLTAKCVCSVSCCKIIISSRTVPNYKHVLTVWSVKVNRGEKNIDPKTWLFPAGTESEASPIYFLLNWNRNAPSAHRPKVPPSFTPSAFTPQFFS